MSDPDIRESDLTGAEASILARLRDLIPRYEQRLRDDVQRVMREALDALAQEPNLSTGLQEIVAACMYRSSAAGVLSVAIAQACQSKAVRAGDPTVSRHQLLAAFCQGFNQVLDRLLAEHGVHEIRVAIRVRTSEAPTT